MIHFRLPPLVHRRVISRIAAALLSTALLLPAPAQEIVLPEKLPDLPSDLGNTLPVDLNPTTWFPLHLGSVSLHPHVSYRFVHVDGLPSEPGEEETTEIQSISPGMMLRLGEHWTLDYTGSWTSYSNDAFEDYFGSTARLKGGADIADWNMGLTHRFSSTSTPLLETGQQTEQKMNSTTVQASRAVGQRSRVELTGGLSTRDTEFFADFKEWRFDAWFNYRLSPIIDTAVGLGHSKLDMDEGSDSRAMRYLGRINLRPSDRLTFSINGGLEERKFQNSSRGNLRTPTYGSELTYLLSETTTIGVTVDRSVSASYFQNAVDRTTSWRASVDQRLFGRFLLSLRAGRRKTDYEATLGGVDFNRNDHGNNYSLRLSTSIRTRGSLSAFLARSTNGSNDEAYSFSSNQFGFEFSYSY